MPYLRAKGDDLYDRVGGNSDGGDLFADQDHQRDDDASVSVHARALSMLP